MLTINQNLTTVNYNTGSGTGRIKFIVIHYTGNDGDTAWANTNYFKNINRGASAHYFVDENGIWQCVEDKNIAWHCGTSGTYYHASCRNSNSIGIEMCSRKNSGGSGYCFKDGTVDNTVWLVKMLMEKYGVPVENVVRHYDVTRKQCPEPYVTGTAAWNAFKARLTLATTDFTTKEEEVDMTEAEVKALIASEVNTQSAAAAKTAVENYIKEQEAKTASDWATAFWNAGAAAGVFDGTMPRGYLTREQAATTYRKMGILELSKDKEASDWAKIAWDKAVELGVVDGSSPRGPLTREQFVVVLDKLGLLDIQEAVLAEEVESVDQSASWNSYEPQGE